VEPEGGATAPDNVPQDRQDGQMVWQMYGGRPGVDQNKLLIWSMKKMGVSAPETLLAPAQDVPPETLDLLKQALVQQAGMDPSGAQALIENALHSAIDIREQQAQASARSPSPAPVDGQAPPQGPEQDPQQQAA
jgi:hypothetical protein